MSALTHSSTSALLDYAHRIGNTDLNNEQNSEDGNDDIDKVIDELEQYGKDDFFTKKQLRHELRDAKKTIQDLKKLLEQQQQQQQQQEQKIQQQQQQLQQQQIQQKEQQEKQNNMKSVETSVDLTQQKEETTSTSSGFTPSFSSASSSPTVSTTTSSSTPISSTTSSGFTVSLTPSSTTIKSSSTSSSPTFSTSSSSSKRTNSSIPTPDLSSDSSSETDISGLQSSPLAAHVVPGKGMTSNRKHKKPRYQSKDFEFTSSNESTSATSSSNASSTKSSNYSSGSVRTPSTTSILASTNTSSRIEHSHNKSKRNASKKKDSTDFYRSYNKFSSDSSSSDGMILSSSDSLMRSSSNSSLSSSSTSSFGSSDSLDKELSPLKQYRNPFEDGASLTVDGRREQQKQHKFTRSAFKRTVKEIEQENFDQLLDKMKRPFQHPTTPECTSEVIRDLERFTSAKFYEMDKIISNIQHQQEKARMRRLEEENYRMKKNLRLIKTIIHAIRKKRVNRKVDELFGRVSEKELLQHIAIEFHDFLGANEDISRETAMKLVSRVSKTFLKNDAKANLI